jgi:hypothetical protein
MLVIYQASLHDARSTKCKTLHSSLCPLLQKYTLTPRIIYLFFVFFKQLTMDEIQKLGGLKKKFYLGLTHWTCDPSLRYVIHMRSVWTNPLSPWLHRVIPAKIPPLLSSNLLTALDCWQAFGRMRAKLFGKQHH